MDKKKIEEFATSSRKQLIENLTYEANRIGITKDKIHNPTDTAEDMQTYTTAGVTNTIYAKQIEQREQLVQEIQNNGFEQTIEKIAYTWFNRIIAIRYMEINNYLPTHTRVLSSITPGQKEPDIITEALNLKEYFQYTTDEEEKIYQYKEENQTDELFKLLFIKQCNKLNEILPELFETIDDYTEILFNIQLSNQKNIINKLVTSIPEEDFQDQVEIIGWIYQYYNKELKDETYKNIKKVKVGKDRIPAVTQLFTPDWIVKYMVENSLGKLWLENHENKELKDSWKYFLDEAKQSEEIQEKLEEIKSTYKDTKPEEIKILDPSMGSGHILVYVFDVLMQIYTSQGYTKKEAVTNILENNIYGIDIDDRAYQLAYFAIMMKARSYHRRILNQNIKPNLVSIQETTLTDELIEKINSKELTYLIETCRNGKTLGSITKFNNKINLNSIEKVFNEFIQNQSTDIFLISHANEINLIKQIIKQFKILNQKYDIVITNPPYMGNSNMDKILKDYLKKEYPNTKQDLFSVFMEQGLNLIKENGFNVMVTMQSWMFLSSFEKFRQFLFNNSFITNLLHMDNMVMGIAFGTSATIFRKNTCLKYRANFSQIKYKNLENNVPTEFPITSNNNNQISLEKLSKIPHLNLAYWVTDKIIDIFNQGSNITDYIDSFQGIITGDNKTFLRMWWELDNNKIAFNQSNMSNINLNESYWIPYNKGGPYRKWYGNQDYVINWKNGPEDKTRGKKTFSEYYLKEYVSWSYITSSTLATRYFPAGFLWDVAGSGIFDKSNYLKYLQALIGSKIGLMFLDIINPTLNYPVENILDLPILVNDKYKKEIDELVDINIDLSKKEWDSYEISWNFNKHPLMCENNLKKSYDKWNSLTNEIFISVKENEEKINEIFNEIYGIETIDSQVKSEDVTIRLANKKRDFESFISYIIGCIFGRYSLDEEGLIFAGGEFDINKYKSIKPDEDNIIPVLDEEYFDDDVVNQIVNFIKNAFGEDTLDENLKFIAESLDVSGKSSREVIRNYMIKKFYSNHVSIYQKCPIYWMFDSGKENAFKCLIYMHRYEPNLVSRIRHDYLQKTQRAIEENIKQQDNIIKGSENKTQVNRANKEMTKLIKQLDEIKLYDLALAHIANEQIELDLDDGVKVNYAKFQNVEVIDPKTIKTKKINLLKKL